MSKLFKNLFKGVFESDSEFGLSKEESSQRFAKHLEPEKQPHEGTEQGEKTLKTRESRRNLKPTPKEDQTLKSPRNVYTLTSPRKEEPKKVETAPIVQKPKQDDVAQKELDMELQKISKELAEEDLLIGNLEKELAEKTKIEDDAQKEYQKKEAELKQRLEALEKEIEQEKSKFETEMSTYSLDLSQKENSLKKEFETAKKLSGELAEKLISKQTQLVHKSEKNEEEKQKRFSQIKQKEEKQKENQTKMNELTQVNEGLEAKLKELKIQIQTETNKLDQLKQEKENQERNLKLEKENLEISIQNLEKDLQESIKTTTELDKKIKSIYEEIIAQDKEYQLLEQEIAEIVKKDEEISKQILASKDLDKITALCNKLSSNDSSLKELNLTGQQITNEDVVKIMKSLVNNKVLLKLNLKQNPLTGDKFIDDLLVVLQSNKTLEYLSFEKCPISRTAIDKILKVLPQNKGLTEIFLGDNEKDEDLDITDEIMDRNFEAK